MFQRLLLLYPFLLLLLACSPAAIEPEPTPPAMETLLPPGAIEVLEAPPVVGAAEASAYIGPQEMVLGVEVGDEARAYPVGLMNRHEIANDRVGGEAIAVTLCPLCNSGVVLSREITGTDGSELALTFEVSGKILDGTLVMLDRESGSLWSQSRLRAVEGPLAGTSLKLLPSSQMPWQEWVTAHPDTTLVVDPEGRRSAPLLRGGELPLPGGVATPEATSGYVIGIASPSGALAFPLDQVEEARVVNGELPDLPPFVLVALGPPGEVVAWQRLHQGQRLTFEWQGQQLRDRETGTRWSPRSGRAEEGPLAGATLQPLSFLLTHWLGWQDLHPGSEIWQCDRCAGK